MVLASIQLVDRSYIGYVRSTGPVLYVPMVGSRPIELVRGALASVSATPPAYGNGPFRGSNSYRFTVNNELFTIATHTSYHPGDTFTAGGWFFRSGNGSNSENMMSLGASDLDVAVGYGPASGKFALGKNGVQWVWVANVGYTGVWYHGIITKTGATVVAYINGASIAGTLTNGTIIASSANVTFGGATTEDFNGYLAHWAVWNRVLTPAEVKALYVAGKDQM